MKKRLSDFIAGFLIVAQLFSSGVGIASVKAETSGESENTSSATVACSDGADNDGDELIDIKDPGCHKDWDADNVSSYDPLKEGEYEVSQIDVSSNGVEGNSLSFSSAVSDNGLAAFVSFSDNLVQGDTNDNYDIFVHDHSSGETTRVSVASDGTQANQGSSSPTISADGRFIAFESYADNLVQGDMNGKSDVFIHDFLTKETKRISVAPDGTEANDDSSYPQSSSDGKYVIFDSRATNLAVGSDSENFYGRFLYDIRTNRLEPFLEGGDIFISPTSADGRYSAFNSLYSAEDGGYTESYNVFLKDNQEGWVRRISKTFDDLPANGNSMVSSISADGRYVGFDSYADNMVEGDNNDRIDSFVYDRLTGKSARISLGKNGEEKEESSSSTYLSVSGEYILFGTETYPKNISPQAIMYSENIRAAYASDGIDHVFMVRNPLFAEINIPPIPTNLSQKNESDGTEAGIGRIINEGASESADSIFLSAKVEDSKGEKVSLEVEINNIDETGKILSTKNLTSNQVSTGEIASIDYTPTGGLYSWKARTINETGNKSDWTEFGNNSPTDADFISSNFSFVFLTDVHLGSNLAPLATADATLHGDTAWYESRAYPRFTDVLYNIEQLNPRPDFILIGGDNVEYNNSRWLEDFKSITGDFSSRTGIGIYFVPGNHDRYDSESSRWSWGDLNFSGGNDYLHNFLSVMGNPQNATSFFEGTGIMDLTTSGSQGLNQYNYYFNYKGFQFIGLDSGEDTGVSDPQPEGSGLNGNVMDKLDTLIGATSGVSKIIFLHHPIYNDKKDPLYQGEEKTDKGEIAENEAIVNNWTRFINDCNNNDVQLVLSGHTHNSLIFDSLGEGTDLGTWGKDKVYPLYLQTQSAGKGDNHGYRIIDVKNGKATPHEPETNIPKYEKIYSDLDADTGVDLRTYDIGNGKEITNENNQSSTSFFAPASDKIIVYKATEKSQFEVRNGNSSENIYDLQLQKREAGTDNKYNMAPVLGYKIKNSDLCGGSGFCSFMTMQEGDGYTDLKFKNIKVNGNASNTVFVNWNEINKNLLSSTIDGLSFGAGNNYATTYSRLPVSVTIDLNSPGELRAYDKDGNTTGLVNGEIVENIPNSIYTPESETVYVFGNTEGDVVDGLKTQVVGSYEATYDLTLALSENDEEKAKFTADDISTNSQTTHQFSIDWESLKQGKDGVTMQFDENKDGQFEKTLTSNSTLTFPKAKLTADKYTATEGTAILFDASPSTSTISLYEWDFNGDGIYDASSSSPTISHTYGDDFQGKVILKVTDNKGLTNTSSSEVTITNTNPTVSISRFEIADTMDKFIIEGNLTDSGWLDTHTVSIDWGDNITENIPIKEENNPNSTGKIIATHKYNQLKNYTATLTITDDNNGTVISQITLKSPRQIKQSALSKLQTIQTNDKNARKDIDKAIISLKETLKNKYWKDDFRLNLLYAINFFTEEQKTTKTLEKILSDKKKYTNFQDTPKIQETIKELSQSDTFLAKAMVYDAGSRTSKTLKRIKSWIDKLLKV